MKKLNYICFSLFILLFCFTNCFATTYGIWEFGVIKGTPLAKASALTVEVKVDEIGESSTLASIYSDVSGTSPLSNPMTVTNGSIQFYADQKNRYKITITSYDGYQKVLRHQAVSLSTKYLWGSEDAFYYPYVTNWEAPEPTTDLNVTFKAIRVIFNGTAINIDSWSHTFTASKITNVWIDSSGVITYEAVDPTSYTTLHRYPLRMLLAEVTTGPTKVVAVYYRGDSRTISISSAKRPMNKDEIFVNYYIKPHTDDWAEEAFDAGDVVKTTEGALYLVIKAGTLTAGEPAIPSYAYEEVTGFHEQTVGTAVITFIGTEGYEGAWKTAYFKGINWYFSNLGIGWLAKSQNKLSSELATEMLNHIKSAINHAVCPWKLETTYYLGMLVVDTEGNVWQCKNNGTSDSTESFDSSPTIGTTEYVDNDITWLCVGLTSTHTPGDVTWQLMDTDPTTTLVTAPDSHDSYAATLMWAVEQMRLAGYIPDTFFTDISQHGITYVLALRNILYYNILLHTTNNLAQTFQYGIVPNGSGDLYNINFLMDNCEVWAGLNAAVSFYSDARYTVDPTYPAYVQGFRDTILIGINALWDNDNGVFDYYYGFDSSTIPSDPIFYPWLMPQAWLQLWDVPVDYYKIRACFQFMQTEWNDWWQTGQTDNLAAIGAHVAFYKHNQTDVLKRQILDRVEIEKLQLSASELYMHDLGYYFWLKEQK